MKTLSLTLTLAFAGLMLMTAGTAGATDLSDTSDRFALVHTPVCVGGGDVSCSGIVCIAGDDATCNSDICVAVDDVDCTGSTLCVGGGDVTCRYLHWIYVSDPGNVIEFRTPGDNVRF